MAERNFTQLIDGQAAQGHHLSVGIDIDWARVPERFGSEPTEANLFNYGTMVMDATAHVAAMFKPNVEFYAAYLREGGLDALARIVEYGRTTHPDVAIAIDAKQGDIGTTNEKALIGMFDQLGDPDAMTVHPWMGKIGMEPHLKMTNKGFLVTAKTSNPGSSELQDVPVSEAIDVEALLAAASAYQQEYLRETYLNEGLPLRSLLPNWTTSPWVLRFRPFWQLLANHVTSPDGWNANDNVGVVIGATYEAEARTARRFAHQAIILSPGLGTQGGKVIDMRNDKGSGVIYNASSSISLPSTKDIEQYGSSEAAIRHLAEATNRQVEEGLGLAA